jgi:polysaccharide export outer membrane protein
MMLLRKIFVIVLFATSVSFGVYAQTPTPAQRPRLTAFGAVDRYVLHPGDVLDIEYRYTPEFNQTVSVQPDGYISLEMGGDLKVAGRNLE